MSALGHKRTFRGVNAMSALPPKADMCSATKDVALGQRRTFQWSAPLMADSFRRRRSRPGSCRRSPCAPC